jgi:two-component system sensor histidine kinase QseC
LLTALGVVSFLFWAVMATLSTRDNIREVNALYDVHLAHTAKAFLFLMDPDDNSLQTSPHVMSATSVEQLLNTWPDLALRPDPQLPKPDSNTVNAMGSSNAYMSRRVDERYGASLRYQLWRDDGQLLFRSDNAPAMPITSVLGYSETRDAQDQGWRSYAVHDRNHQVRIIVSEPNTFRAQISNNMILSATTPFALGLPVLFLLLWFSIWRGLYPLAALSQEIAKRSPDSLTPLQVDGVPDEVRPIVITLNDLLKRVAHTLDNERRFTDDAAHQLRTPLAIIQSQLYSARHSPTPEALTPILDQLQTSVARAIRLVNQLLAVARLDPQDAAPELSAIDLAALAEDACTDLATLALQRQQTLELIATPQLAPVLGNAGMLTMLIVNLVENAMQYTQSGGLIHVQIQPSEKGVTLCILDDGPGIPPEEHDKVQQRFYRLAQQSQPGTGLGLSICKRIAELHHSTLKLGPGLQSRGLSVSLELATSTHQA